MIGIITKKGWALGLAVQSDAGDAYMMLDEKSIRICNIITKNHEMTGGILAVKVSEAVWDNDDPNRADWSK